MTAYQPGDQVRVRDADDKVYEVVSGAFGLGSLIIIRDPETGEREAMPESWLTPAALRDLPPEPPQPPEPTEPGTVVWDRDGTPIACLFDDAAWIDRNGDAYRWAELVDSFGPLTTTPPGTIPAEAVADDRAEELAEAMTGVYGIAVGSLPGAIRFLLARIRNWQPT